MYIYIFLKFLKTKGQYKFSILFINPSKHELLFGCMGVLCGICSLKKKKRLSLDRPAWSA